MAQQITITAKLYNLVGTLQPSAKLRMQLCGFGSQVPLVPGVGLITSTAPIDIYAQTNPTGVTGGGEALWTVWGNDVIQPAGTYYTLVALDANNNAVQANAYQFTGTAAVDLSTATTFNPNPVFPPTPAPVPPVTAQGFVRLNYAASLVLPAPTASVVTYACLLGGNVTAMSFSTAPSAGQIIGFLFEQDTITGNHSVVFPANIVDPVQPTTAKGARSLQLFQAADDGYCYPTGVMSSN